MALLERDLVVEAVERLIKRTEENRQEWLPSEDGDDVYLTHTEKFSYSIESRDSDGQAPYIFEVYRVVAGVGEKESTVIKVGELVTAPTASSTSLIAGRNRLLGKLYAQAKTSSLGISGLSSDLLSDLE